MPGGARAPREPQLSDRVAALLKLSQDDEACRLLGVEGSLEAQLDITFVDDPLDWVAYDIAQAVKASAGEEEEEPGPTLAGIVAELKLCALLQGSIDQTRLERLVRDYVEEDED